MLRRDKVVLETIDKDIPALQSQLMSILAQHRNS
jgi:uncharacterized protein with HEPN domain